MTRQDAQESLARYAPKPGDNDDGFEDSLPTFYVVARRTLPAALNMLERAMEALAFEHSQGFPVRPECDCRNCSNRRSMEALLSEWEGRR